MCLHTIHERATTRSGIDATYRQAVESSVKVDSKSAAEFFSRRAQSMLASQVASRVCRVLLLALLILGLAPLIPASATTQLTVDGTFVGKILKPEFSGSLCPAGTADYCGPSNSHFSQTGAPSQDR